MSAKTMAEVLAEHKDWTDDYAYKCSCRWESYTEDTQDHQAAALSAAGFGLVADAKAEALEEAADATNVNDDRGLNTPEEVERRGYLQRHNRMSVTRWLRARASELRTP